MKKRYQNKYIPHNRPTIGTWEKRAAIHVLKSRMLAQGSEVEAFEEEFCQFLQLPTGCAVAVSSGTAALYLALLVLQAKGKKIAIPAYTCTALRHAVTLAEGTVTLIDSTEKSPNMDVSKGNIHRSIMIVPHMFGIPQAISQNNGLIIEDGAQSMGAFVNGVPVGLQGDIGVFSFYATKLMTAGGQGGMVVSEDKSIIDFIKDYRAFDEREDIKRRFNFQMTDLQAAIGRIQLQRFPDFIKRRAEIFAQYVDAGLPLLQADHGISAVPYRAILITSKQPQVIHALQKENIDATVPLKNWHINDDGNEFFHAQTWAEKIVSLPIYPTLKDKDVKRVIKIAENVL